MVKNWEAALKQILETYNQSNQNIDWILVGSIGSVLQGCTFSPNDIDLYTKNVEGVHQFAELLDGFSLERKSPYDHNDINWLSSKEEKTFTQTFSWGFSWTKGRWVIKGAEVEVVSISESAGIPDSFDGDGIWEGGKYIWDLAKKVRIGEYEIPVVPLEIQLESNLRRERFERADEICRVLLQNGYDSDMLKKALSTFNMNYFNQYTEKNSGEAEQ
ncbi:hypothetical protein ACFO3D_09285 [Virgibacillus kekensis]|uniref:Uncharacterized protein n=1 Tax=Virgibacillus kekensis TaxID=202261 RepID=A0ABV9DHT6_9BACI